MNQERYPITRLLAIALIFLLWQLIDVSPTSGQGDTGPVPPPPPTWEDAPRPSEQAQNKLLASTNSAGCSASAHCNFLPVISYTKDPAAEAMEIYRRLYIPSQNPYIGWSGNANACYPGETSAAFLTAMKQRINYFREMAGVPPITTLSSTYNTMGQAAALMMSANGKLSHSPTSDWTCYTELGKTGAGKSNLFLGMFGPEAIDGYIRDPGEGNTAAGHRRWILHPPTTTMGTGDIPNGGQWAANSLYVFDASIWAPRPATRDPFVAWPPPGYVPYNTVYPRWSFAVPSADFSGSTVTVKQGSTVIPVTKFTQVNNYGENTLVWQIASMTDWEYWPKPTGDVSYTVTITNVIVNAVSKNYSYTVTVFDPAR